mmetsp:Transcript_5830/g.12777  ORF Transcript_5830/g.12777 Transcript_5830/m.12777 type:complete len:468 (+) Transcript_5830:167-1570(+)
MASHPQRRLVPLLLLLVSHLSPHWSSSSSSRSSTNTALAFVHQRRNVVAIPPHLKKSSVQTTATNDIIPSSLRVRGGGNRRATSAAVGATKNADINSDNDDDKYAKTAQQAIQSIRFCCKMCVASVLSEISVLFVDADLFAKFFGSSADTPILTWVDYIDIFDGLALLLFAGGLWRISQLYFISFSNMDDKMDRQHLLHLFTFMTWIWGGVAASTGGVALSMAATLPSHGNSGIFAGILGRIACSRLVVGAAGILGVGAMITLVRCRNIVDAEVQSYREKHGIVEEEPKQMKQLDALKVAGYAAYRSQALCSASFAVMSIFALLKWTVSFEITDGGKLNFVGQVFAVSDFLTPFAMTALLVTLNRALVRAAIAEIIGDDDSGDANDATVKKKRKSGSGRSSDDEIYHDLFVAQTGFYKKAGETLKGATIFRLLPYIATFLCPYLLKALEWISPSGFAKAAKVFGVAG